MKSTKTPKWIDRFIKWYCHPMYIQEITGDMQEMYEKWKHESSSLLAILKYAWNAVLFMRIYNSRFNVNFQELNHLTMIQHAIKLSLRNIRKNKVYSLGNILGLAIGICVSLVIYLHVRQELSYEKAYAKHDRIFRISSHSEWAKSPPSMAEELNSFFPNVEKTCRFSGYRSGAVIVGNEDKRFISSEVYLTDHSVVDVFDLQFVHGSSFEVLEKPYTVLINSTTSKKLFGNENPVGRTIEVNESERRFEVQGVIEDLPKKSHLKADVLISMPTFYDETPDDWTSSKGWMVMYTYALLNSHENEQTLRAKMPDFMLHYLHEQTANDMIENGEFMEVMALTDIHLKSDKVQEMRANSNITYIYIFSTLAVFILVIASVNFINIFTTLAFKRAKEIGLRKIVGAHRTQLILQLLSEACINALLASAIGALLLLLVLPSYNLLAEVSILPKELAEPINVLLLFGLAFSLGIVSGLYPSLLVTRQRLTASILSNSNPKAQISLFRKGLIVFQFALSLFILVSTVVVNRQMTFIQNKDLGFDSEQLLSFRIYGEMRREMLKDRKSFFPKLLQNPDVQSVSLSSNLMGEPLSVEYFTPAGADPETDFGSVNMVWTDENYLETMGMELVSGRNFRSRTDTSIVFLVSEKLSKSWGIDPVGEMAEFRDQTGQIVGVFKDVNYYSLHSDIDPMVICLRPTWASNILVKINSENTLETLSFIESQVKNKHANAIVEFDFLNQKLEQLYKGENSMFQVFKVFSFIALIISCLGLLGIAAIEVQRRTKEVGIRKVLGASGNQILKLLSKQFAIMLVSAIAISLPLAYYMAKEWLADYSYGIELTGLEFLIPSIGLIFLSLLVVGLHSRKVINSNPTESLRNE